MLALLMIKSGRIERAAVFFLVVQCTLIVCVSSTALISDCHCCIQIGEYPKASWRDFAGWKDCFLPLQFVNTVVNYRVVLSKIVDWTDISFTFNLNMLFVDINVVPKLHIPHPDRGYKGSAAYRDRAEITLVII
jgi:hypothetical protein